MRVLLDTVAFLFAIENPDRLSRTARAVMREPANQRELSVVSLAEVAMKNAAGKLNLSREDALEALRRLQVSLVPYAEAHVLQLMTLPVHHRDPFDRIAHCAGAGRRRACDDLRQGVPQVQGTRLVSGALVRALP